MTAFAELGAGITIDVDLGWFGHIRTPSRSTSTPTWCSEGPEFRGKATIDLDVTSATIAFGDWSDRSTPVLDWASFDAKYLRPGGAAMLTATPGNGLLPPSTDGSRKAPTGGVSDPHLLLPEFELTISTTAASSALTANGAVALPRQVFLAIGPMQLGGVDSTLAVSVASSDGTEFAHTLAPAALTGQFPLGVWGPQPLTEPKPVPKGDVVEAGSGIALTSEANISVGTVPIDYHQIETGPRHQLPFLAEAAVRGDRAGDVAAAAAAVAAAPNGATATLDIAREWLTTGAQSHAVSPLADAVFTGARAAPPQLVPLTRGMQVEPDPAVAVPQQPPAPAKDPVDTSAKRPRLEALLSALPAPEAAVPDGHVRARTTVGQAGDGAHRTTPRRIADVQAAADPLLAAQLVTAAPAAMKGEKLAGRTVIASGRLPASGRAGAGGELRRRPGLPAWQRKRVAGLNRDLARDGIALGPGEVAILGATDALHDVRRRRPTMAVKGELPVRLVALDVAGAVTGDDALPAEGTVPLPLRTARIVALAGPGDARQSRGAPGWHAGTRLVQAGPRTLVGPDCTITSSALATTAGTARGGQRVASAFVTAADAVRGFSTVTTRLPAGITAVGIVLEDAARVDDERADALELGVTGARRATGADGAELPPHVVVSGSRSVAVYALRPEPPSPDRREAPVEVTVASGEHLHLSGVFGSFGPAADLAEAVRAHDLSDVVADLVPGGSGLAHVSWQAPAETPEETPHG